METRMILFAFLIAIAASACLAAPSIDSKSASLNTLPAVPVANIDIEAYRTGVLDCMNKYRQIHQVGPLRRNEDLTKLAQEWAQYLIDNDKFEHRGNVGENLWAYWHSADVPPQASAPCESWYSEEPQYDYNTGDPKALHFTAMVWKATTDTGVGIANANGRYVVVVDYTPTGNVIGDFKNNVFPPKNKV